MMSLLGSLRAGSGGITLSLIGILLGIIIGSGAVGIFLIMRENR